MRPLYRQNPQNKSLKFEREISIFLLICFTVSNFFPVPLQAANTPGLPEVKFPAEISKLKVPAEMGRIEDSFKGKGDELVILVQDAHAIPDAQRSIQRLIDHFQKQYGVGLVGLEGVASPLDFQIFKSFPDKELLKKTFQEYFEKSELTGAAAAALFNESKGLYHGIEDWKLYEEGLGFYLESLRKQPELLEKLSNLENQLRAKKEKTYSKKLFEIDQILKKFHENKSDLLNVLKLLSAIKPPAEHSELDIILEAGEDHESQNIEMEVKAIAKKIEADLKSKPMISLTQPLSPTGRGQGEGLSLFFEKKQAFQTSQISAAMFGLYLKEVADREGVPVNVTGKLLHFIESQKQMRDIEGTKFFRDFEHYAAEIKETLFQTQKERELDLEGHRLDVLGRAVRLELSCEDWNELKVTPTSLLPRKVGEEIGGGIDLTSHRRFYENATKRDQAFLDNLSSLMRKNKTKSALLVAGGFHTQSLTERLKKNNTSYFLLKPQMNSVPKNNLYREHMQGKISWKDYFEIENGKVDLYKALVRAVRDNLLKASREDIKRLLKSWRDQIIRDLAEQGKIEKAADYTSFLDEKSESVKDPKLQKIDQFIESLQNLNLKSQATPENILKLLRPATMADPYGSPAPNNFLDARLVYFTPTPPLARLDKNYGGSLLPHKMGEEKEGGRNELRSSPSRPADFGKGNFKPFIIGGDGLVPDPNDSSHLINMRRIETHTIPFAMDGFKILNRFALPGLTFQIVPLGEDKDWAKPSREKAGVNIAQIKFLLQVWLNNRWYDLDDVELEEGIPFIIKRGARPPVLNEDFSNKEIDLEGKVGKPVAESKDDLGKSEGRTVIFWTSSEGIQHTVYLPRQSFDPAMSRGAERTEGRMTYNMLTKSYIPDYLQTGHVEIEIVEHPEYGTAVKFADQGSTNQTVVEVNQYLLHDQTPPLGYDFHQEVSESLQSITNVSKLPQGQQEKEFNLVPGDEVEFEYDGPFHVAAIVRKQEVAPADFYVKQGLTLHVLHGGKKEWEPLVNNRYSAEEGVPVAGHSVLDIKASIMEYRAYKVIYNSETKKIKVMNRSASSVRITFQPSFGTRAELRLPSNEGSTSKNFQTRRLEMRAKKTALPIESEPEATGPARALAHEAIAKKVFFARQQAAVQRLWFEKKILSPNHPLSQFVTSQLQKIIRSHKAEIFVIEDDEENAFATGTNQIYITTGMLKLFDNEEELLALLMHELTHIEKEHSYAHYLLDPFDLYGLGARRLAEFQADTAMLLELDKRGINPIGAISFTKKQTALIERKKHEQNSKYDKILSDLAAADPVHGSMALRHVNLRELIRFADLLHLSEDVHPIDWKQYEAPTALPRPQVRQKIKELEELEPRDFWLQFGQLLQTAPQEVWPQKVRSFIRNQGVQLSEEKELLILLALHDVILQRKEPFVYEKDGKKVTIPKEEIPRYFDPALLTEIVEENLFEKLGLWLTALEMLDLAQKSFDHFFQNGVPSNFPALLGPSIKLRDTMQKAYQNRYGEIFQFRIDLDTLFLGSFMLTYVKGKAVYTYEEIGDPLKSDVHRNKESHRIHFLNEIPFEGISEDVLNLFMTKTQIGLVSSDDLLKELFMALDFPLNRIRRTLVESDLFYDTRDGAILAFKTKVISFFNLVLKNSVPPENKKQNLFEGFEQGMISAGESSPFISEEEEMEKSRAALARQNYLVFSEIEFSQDLLRGAQTLYARRLARIESLDAKKLDKEFKDWFLSLSQDPDRKIRFEKVVRRTSEAIWLHNHWDFRLRYSDGRKDFVTKDEKEKMIVLALYAAGEKEFRFLNQIDDYFQNFRFGTSWSPAVAVKWLASLIRSRNEVGMEGQWDFGLRERGKLSSILMVVKHVALNKYRKMPAERIMGDAVRLVSEWGMAFVDINKTDYDTSWREISIKLNSYLSKKKDFPQTPQDFEKILAISLLSQESFAAMSTAAVSFREMIKRSATFNEAFGYIKKYNFLPRSLVREALISLVEEKANSKEDLDQLTDWFLKEMEGLLDVSSDVMMAELSQTLLRLIPQPERLDFFKHIISTNEDDKGFKTYMAEKWWKIFNGDALEISNINDIALLAYYGEKGDPAKIETARFRSAESLASIDIIKIKMLFFQEFYTAMFRLDSILIYLLLRSLTLEGSEGIFRSEAGKKDLIRHFIRQYLKIKKTETSDRVIQNVTETLSEDLDPEDLFYFVGPALSQVALQVPSHPYPIEQIIDSLLQKQLKGLEAKYPGISDKSKFPQTHEILRARIKAYVTGIAPSLITENIEVQDGLESVASRSQVFFPEKISYINFENAASERLAPLIGQRKIFSKQITPIELAVEVSKHVGSLAVRLLQLVGMYFDLSVEDRQVLSQVYDAVQGQTKIQAYLVMKREAERNPKFKALFETILEVRKMLGGGSIVTVYETIDQDQDKWALGVKNPNAGYRSGELEHFGQQILDGLIKRANGGNLPEIQYYKLLKLLLVDAHQWVLDELNDPDYIAKNKKYEEQNDFRSKSPDKFKAADNVPVKLFIPVVRDTGTDLIRWEKFVQGQSLNSLLTQVEQKNDPHLTQIAQQNVAALTQNYFYQLFETGVVHSDIHPGQFIMMAGGMLGVLDRKNILLFDVAERKFLLEVIADSLLGNRDRAFDRVVAKFIAPERLRDKAFLKRLKTSITQRFDPKLPEKSVADIFLFLKQEGIDVPIKWILVTKNISSLNKMAQLAGLRDITQALFYSPDGPPDIMQMFQTVSTLLPKSSADLMGLLGQQWLSGKLPSLLGNVTGKTETPSKPKKDKKSRSELRESSNERKRVLKAKHQKRGDDEEEEKLTKEEKKKVSVEALMLMEANYGFMPDEHPAVEFLKNKLKQLLPDMEEKDLPAIHLLASTGEGVNAMAFVNWTIVVTPELLQFVKTEEELDYVLLHEINHLERNHGAPP